MPEVRVCAQDELANGATRIVRAGHVEVAVIRENGLYYAYRNWCPHQGGPACEGVRTPRVEEIIDEAGLYLGKRYVESDLHIICPWHGYAFHLADGVNVCDPKLRLQKFEVAERDGHVYVAI
jgi:nitrite reductase/ring-hydroxylating ferredoxin subunit